MHFFVSAYNLNHINEQVENILGNHKLSQWQPSPSPAMGRLERAGSARSLSFTSLCCSLSALVVKRRSLYTPVPVFDLGVLHHVVKCLQALHHSEDAEHSLQKID